MSKCPICTREVEMHTSKHGTIVSCVCGLSSRLFKGAGDADKWINTRDGKQPPEIRVGATSEKKAIKL